VTRVAPLLAILALLGQAAWAADEAQRLERIRLEIEEREARARDFADEAEGYLGELEAIDRELIETRRSLRRLRARQKAAKAELGEAERGLEQAEQALEETRRDLNRRLVALYKFRATGGLPALYSAVDFQGLMRVTQGLGQVLDGDATLFARFRRVSAEWAQKRDDRASLIAELEAAGREVDRRNDAVRRRLVERKNLVALLRSRAEQERQTAGELREAARRLEATLSSLPREGGPAVGKGLARGRVAWPVSGPVRLGYGRQVDPEFGTETLRTGVEIEAEAGTPVRAVAPGRVLFAGWFRGYGQMVIVDHGKSSMTVSGFLEELSVEADETVQAGQVLGTVGQTGSLSGPGLYFEIRQASKPVDPEKWLQ